MEVEEPAQLDALQDNGTTAPETSGQVGGQNSSTALAPVRVSQRTQNAKKQGRNEMSDATYKTKSKVSARRS